MIGDLHCHSRLSDGSMSIDDLVFYAKRAGLDFLALTDHDTMDGVNRAVILGKRHGLNVIPAVEISAMDMENGRKVHILCYLPDKPDRLLALMNPTLESRAAAGRRMIAEVMRYYPVTEEHIARYTSGSKSIYKAHIMQALLDLGYDCQSHGELYHHLFASDGGLCARDPVFPDVYDAVRTVREAGGIAVLAHPPVYRSMELMEELARRELIQGVEASHPRIGGAEAVRIAEVAEQYDLVRTGGTDFHGVLTSRPQPLATCITTEGWLNDLFLRKKALAKLTV